ncbi:MAG: putative membrane protein [Glomeribacter sp. 1016415]|nr:putative membrane protein [Glomeribacter sp. 1016415]
MSQDQFGNELAFTGSSVLSQEQERRLRTLTHVLYGLYAFSLVIGVTGAVAVIINYIKRSDTNGTFYASHFSWQIRTFWWSLGLLILSLLFNGIFIGKLILWGSMLWVVYRLIKGWLRLNDRKPV